MKRSSIISITSGLLIFLWIYAAGSKLLNYERSRGEMFNQALPHSLEEILVWALPLTEIITATLLLFSRTRLKGTLVSLILLVAFTVYIVLVQLNHFDYVPCSCGGVIGKLSWNEHLIFNLFFLTIASISSVVQIRLLKDIPIEQHKNIICK